MKTGQSLTDLAAKLMDIQSNAKDYVVPTERLTAVPTADRGLVLQFSNGDVQQLQPNAWSSSQLAEYAEIPKAYFDRINRENPQLAAFNVNHGLSRQRLDKQGKPQQRMVRAYRGELRALVSSRYRRLDSADLLEAVLPDLVQSGLTVQSSELTLERLYVKAVSTRLTAEIAKGDVVQYGIVISNSDVGAGSVRVEPLAYRLVCTNGMISESAIKKFHLGRELAGTDTYELLTDGTRQLTDAAFWAQVRDVVRHSLREEVFSSQVERFRAAQENRITNFDLPKVVELSTRAIGVTNQKSKDGILAYLANGADGAGLTQWGLAQAFSAAARADELTYDEATELERAAGRVIDLPRSDWKRIAEVA